VGGADLSDAPAHRVEMGARGGSPHRSNPRALEGVSRVRKPDRRFDIGRLPIEIGSIGRYGDRRVVRTARSGHEQVQFDGHVSDGGIRDGKWRGNLEVMKGA
jgi:hypothetical protein